MQKRSELMNLGHYSITAPPPPPPFGVLSLTKTGFSFIWEGGLVLLVVFVPKLGYLAHFLVP